MKRLNKKKLLRVAMIGNYPMDDHSIDGGVQAVTVYLANALAATNRLDLHVVTFKDGMHNYKIEKKRGFNLHIIPNQSLGVYTFYYLNYCSLKHCLKRINPDMLHAQGAGMPGYLAVKTGIPSLITFHGMLAEDAKYMSKYTQRLRQKLYSLICERYCRNNASHVINISPYVKKYFGSKLRAKTYYIPNPVKEDFFNLGGTEEKGRVLFAGRISHRKGIMDLIAAVRHIRNKVKIQVVLAGTLDDSKYVNRIRSYICQYRMESFISLAGVLNEHQIIEEFKRCSLLVLPSYQETAPMVIQQAMAAAKPVIATSICGIPYQVDDGVTGLLFKPHDVNALCDHLVRLLQNDNLRKKMCKKANEKALAMYHANEVARKTIEVYLEINNE